MTDRVGDDDMETIGRESVEGVANELLGEGDDGVIRQRVEAATAPLRDRIEALEQQRLQDRNMVIERLNELADRLRAIEDRGTP